jgi:hypothetical protein
MWIETLNGGNTVELLNGSKAAIFRLSRFLWTGASIILFMTAFMIGEALKGIGRVILIALACILSILLVLGLGLGCVWLIFRAVSWTAFHWFNCSDAAATAWGIGVIAVIFALLALVGGGSKAKRKTCTEESGGTGYWRGDVHVNDNGVPSGRQRNMYTGG